MISGSQHERTMLAGRNPAGGTAPGEGMHTDAASQAAERANPVDPGSSPGDSTSSREGELSAYDIPSSKTAVVPAVTNDRRKNPSAPSLKNVHMATGDDPSRDMSWLKSIGRRMGRKRGTGKGSLYIGGKRHKAWYGEWHDYVFGEDGNLRTHHRRVNLGSPADVTHAQARALFDQILERAHSMPPLPAGKTGIADSGRMCAYSECLVSADLLRQGYEIYKPLNPQCRHDLLAVKDGVYQRIEVRVAEIDGKGFGVTDLRRKVGQFDLLALVSRKGHIVYQTPAQAFRPPKPDPIAVSIPLDPGQTKEVE